MTADLKHKAKSNGLGEDVILRVDNLKKHFIVGRKGIIKREPITVKAVDGVSFEVQRGETFGIVGESGSGKSTIAYITMGMYLPTSGTIYFDDRDLFEHRDRRTIDLKKEIQIVFQDPGSSLNPRRTIKQILELPLRIHQPEKDRLREVIRLLDMVDMPRDYMHKYPRQLSGGERQIVAIARALATNPSLIILDEPTSALDVSVQGKVINLLIRLQRELNLTYLFITHDLSVMRNLASRVAIMYLGRIAEVAETRRFFEQPQHPYTQMLLSSIPVLTEEEEALKPVRIISTGEIPSPVNIPSGCSFHTRCPVVMDICRKVDPLTVGASEEDRNHIVRCHLFDQSGRGRDEFGLSEMRIAADIGGTFTDLVYWDDARAELGITKVATTPANFGDGVIHASSKPRARRQPWISLSMAPPSSSTPLPSARASSRACSPRMASATCWKSGARIAPIFTTWSTKSPHRSCRAICAAKSADG